MPTFTGWLYTDAKSLVACPKCQVLAGSDCISPSGKKRWPPHVPRLEAFMKAYPGAKSYILVSFDK